MVFFMAKKALEIRDKTIFDGVFVKYILKFFFITWFKVFGWRTTPTMPEGAGITIAAPHTSNWDIFYAMGAAIIIDVKMYFSIKESWCRMPIIGSLILWMGGIPIDRTPNGKGQVALIKEFVDRHKGGRIFFLFTPEGTRGRVEKWKTGFYHVAQDCGLPIFLAQVDYRTKVSGVFHTYKLTGDKVTDVNAIQASYESIYARFPKDQYPAYSGPIPEISEREAKVMKAMYSLKEAATQAEIAAKARFEELTTEMLEFLIEKGVLEKIPSRDGTTTYRLTMAGNGCLLHVTPSLA
jgi:1-acyl-sn-glycerol-3-phosphate acyltransferase